MSVIICLMPCNDESRHRSIVVCASARIKRLSRTSCILVGTWQLILDRRRNFFRRTMADSDDDGFFIAAVVAPVAVDILDLFLLFLSTIQAKIDQKKSETEKNRNLTYFIRFEKNIKCTRANQFSLGYYLILQVS